MVNPMDRITRPSGPATAVWNHLALGDPLPLGGAPAPKEPEPHIVAVPANQPYPRSANPTRDVVPAVNAPVIPPAAREPAQVNVNGRGPSRIGIDDREPSGVSQREPHIVNPNAPSVNARDAERPAAISPDVLRQACDAVKHSGLQVSSACQEDIRGQHIGNGQRSNELQR